MTVNSDYQGKDFIYMRLLDEFAIQLYSVRDVMEEDFIGVLNKLGSKGFGYTGVEFAGFGGITAYEMKTALEENGLKAIASHTSLDRLLNHLDEEIEYHKIIGAEYIICPFAEMNNKTDILELVQKLTPVAKRISSEGLKFGYHNHAHEFVINDGEYLLDILFDNMPGGTVMELDIYWSEYADINSLDYMEKHKDKLELLHVKQIGEGKRNVEVDKGFIDFEEVIKKAKLTGVKHFILEQEEYEESSLKSAENAVRYIYSL